MKQINKANQMLNEKIGGAKGTEIDIQYQGMERKTDSLSRLVDDVRDRTYEYLQPNPASRAKLSITNNLSKMRGQAKNNPYPQPEGTLGEVMIKNGKDLGDDSNFGNALCDIGESLKQMAGIKYALEDNIKQNFLDPLQQIKDNDIKEVMHLRKKTESRRLDYDCKRRKKSNGSTINEDELQQAEVKFEESKLQSEIAMDRLLQNELEQVTHLSGFAEGFLEYHSQCYEILKEMVKNINIRKENISSRVKDENLRKSVLGFSVQKGGLVSDEPQNHKQRSYKEIKQATENFYPVPGDSKLQLEKNDENCSQRLSSNANINNQNSENKIPFDFSSLIQTPPQQPQPSNQRSPSCRALYDFEAENDEELDFKEGQTIKLISRLDENWLEGEANNRRGRFPISYVEIMIPLPT